MSDLRRLLQALGFTDAERAGFHCIDPRTGSASCSTVNVPDIPDTDDYGQQHWYFNICPTSCTRPYARGNKSEVTRLSSVFIDLDDKVTADPIAALEVVCEALGELPTAVVRSGGGWQPYWAVADGHITDTFTTEDSDALLKAWGRFVNKITGLSFDPTWEPAREFRIPGSKNFKYDPPRPVTVEFFDSPRLTLSALATTLTAHGISIGAPLPRERVTTAQDWRFSIFDCPWAQKAVTGWKTDRPRSSAHTGILGKLVKRECMKRHGCLSRRTYDSTEGLLRNWMENNASYYQGRDFDREFDGALSKAADLVECMTTDEVVVKLGNHLHR